MKEKNVEDSFRRQRKSTQLSNERKRLLVRTSFQKIELDCVESNKNKKKFTKIQRTNSTLIKKNLST